MRCSTLRRRRQSYLGDAVEAAHERVQRVEETQDVVHKPHLSQQGGQHAHLQRKSELIQDADEARSGSAPVLSSRLTIMLMTEKKSLLLWTRAKPKDTT